MLCKPKGIAKIEIPTLPVIEEVESFYEDTPYDLEGQGFKIIIPSNIIDIHTGLEILIGLKLSGPTDTLTKSGNLMDELYKRVQIQNEQQYRNALDKFHII